MRILVAGSPEDVRSAFPVMRQLRPSYDEETFVAQVLRQQRSDGYQLALLEDEGRVVAVAGYRLGECLASGRYLYVDDLVTDAAARSRGHGARLLAWLREEAVRASCDELHLDSGVQRFGAHRFYLSQRMDITSHHFQLALRDRPPKS